MSRTRVSAFGQNASKCYPISVAASTDNQTNASTSNQACVITLPAQAAGTTQQGSWVISQIVWSYDNNAAVVSTGRLTVADSSGSLLDIDIRATTGGTPNWGNLPYSPCLASQVQNSAVTITLAAGGAGVTGKLSVQGFLEA